MARSPFHVRREQHHLAWDGAIPPVVRVESGAEVTFDALDASNGQLTAASTVADIATGSSVRSSLTRPVAHRSFGSWSLGADRRASLLPGLTSAPHCRLRHTPRA